MSSGRGSRLALGLLLLPVAVIMALAGPSVATALRQARHRHRADGQGRRPRESIGGDRPVHRRDLPVLRRCTRVDLAGCISVGGVKDQYAIGRLETTVDQWVAFLNTADPTGTDRHDLYTATESARHGRGTARSTTPSGGQGRQALLRCLPRVGRQAIRLRQFPARGAVRQLALQRALLAKSKTSESAASR